jgi:hypothetical protein
MARSWARVLGGAAAWPSKLIVTFDGQRRVLCVSGPGEFRQC